MIPSRIRPIRVRFPSGLHPSALPSQVPFQPSPFPSFSDSLQRSFLRRPEKGTQLLASKPRRIQSERVQSSIGSPTRLPQDVLIPTGGSAAHERWCASVL